MTSAFLVEGLSSVLGVGRAEVRETIEAVEGRIVAVKMDVSRRLGRALDSANDGSEGAYAVAQVGAQVAFGDKEMLGFVVGVAGTVWGAAITAASLTASSAVVVAGGAVTLPVAIAFLFGLIVMFVCGRYTLTVVRDILGKLRDFGETV